MELFQVKVPINFNLFLIGDDHEGTILRHDDGWNQMVNHVCSSQDGLPVSSNYVVDHGDIIDAIDALDPRYDGQTEDGLILNQIERAIWNRIPIKDHIILILDGNHPRKQWRFGKITQMVCDRLGVRYGDWSSIITYTNRRGELLFKHYCTHGKRSITSTADDPKRRRTNKLLILKRVLKHKSGSCYLMSRGHSHWLDRLPPEHDMYITDDTKRLYQQWTDADPASEYIHPDLRWYVSTGSFVKTLLTNKQISGYGEVSEYDPQPMGYMVAKIRDGKLASVEPIATD